MDRSQDDALLARTAELTLLYDCYGELLADKQRAYLTLHLQEDWTLSEIADDHQVSRQAVYDQVKRGVQLLLQYEEKLQLLRKHQERQAVYAAMQENAIELPLNFEAVRSWTDRLKQWD